MRVVITSSPVSAGRQALQGHGVDDFREEVVLEEVEAGLGLQALDAHAGAHDFGEAVDVQGVEAQAGLDLLAHGFAPGLGPEDAHPEAGVLEIDPHLLAHLGQVQGEGGGAAQGVGGKVLDEHDLAAGLAAGDRDDRGPQALDAVMEAQAPGEEAVAVSHVDDVAPVQAGCRQNPGHELAPGVQVPGGVAHGGGLAGGAGRGVDAHHLLHGHREHFKGVIVPDVLLDGERQVVQVGQGAKLLGFEAGFIQALAVEGHQVVDPLHHGLEPAQLQGLKLFPGQGFVILVSNHGKSDSLKAK